MKPSSQTLTVEQVEPLLHVLRGERIILDVDLAGIYGVPTKRLNEQVKRNLGRFPADFLFQLTRSEFNDLRSQIATSNISDNRSQIATGSQKHRDPRFLPNRLPRHRRRQKGVKP